MYSKIKVTADINLVTGLHIGSGNETSMIGAVDSPVVRDLLTHLPIIPGSSLKGKMRSLLSLALSPKSFVQGHNNDPEEILRLFGSSEKGNIKRARLQFHDAFFSEKTKDEFDKRDISYTETKFENTIDRKTAEAKPRQIERITRGASFDFELVYNVEDETQIEDDFKIIKKGIRLLENDYLGGSGTRGYGRVKFENFDIETVIGDYDSSNLVLE